MSYCVNCGVELHDAEKKCPLCNTPVINPAKPWSESQAGPYPERIDSVLRKVDYRFAVRLCTLLLILPIAVTVVCNLAVNHKISWSVYVIGAVICFFIWFLVPFIYKRPHPIITAFIDAAAASLYLYMIARITNGINWLISLALPIVGTVFVASVIVIEFYRHSKPSALKKAAFIIYTVGIMSVIIEGIISLFVLGRLAFFSSLCVLVVAAVVASVLLLIESNKHLKDEIRRRLYY